MLKASSETWLDQVRTWEDDLLPMLEQAPPSAELRQEYEGTIAQQRELVERLKRVIEKLDGWLEAPPASEDRATHDADEQRAEESA